MVRHWMDETYGSPRWANGIQDLSFGRPAKGYHMPSTLESGGPKFGYEVEVSFSRSVIEGGRTKRQRVIMMLLIRNDLIISSKESTQ